MFPQQLYRLTEKDLTSFSLIVPYFNYKRVDDANAVVETTFTLDSIGDRFLVLCSAAFRSRSGPAQTTERTLILLRSPAKDVSPGEFLLQGSLHSAVTEYFENFVGEILVPPDWRVVAQGSYNAGVAANVNELSVTGYLIPRGSISRL